MVLVYLVGQSAILHRDDVAVSVTWKSTLSTTSCLCGYLYTHPMDATEHPYPTHSLSESVDMLVCLGSHYLYTYAHCSLSVCIHTCMTSIMLRPLASHTHTTVPVACVHTSTLVLLPRLSFSLYVYHTYLYTYLCMCTCVPYSTRSVPHHTVPQYWYSATYTYTCVFPSIHIVYILVQA